MNVSRNYNKEEKITLLKVPLRKTFLPNKIAIFIKTILEMFSKLTTGSILFIDDARCLMK